MRKFKQRKNNIVHKILYAQILKSDKIIYSITSQDSGCLEEISGSDREETQEGL